MYSQFPMSAAGGDTATTSPCLASTSPPFIKGILGFRTTLLFLRRNLKRILRVAATVFLLGLLIAALLPNKYLATALVLADPREQKVTTEQDVLPGIGQDSAALQSLVEIATSDGFLRPLVDRVGRVLARRQLVVELGGGRAATLTGVTKLNGTVGPTGPVKDTASTAFLRC